MPRASVPPIEWPGRSVAAAAVRDLLGLPAANDAAAIDEVAVRYVIQQRLGPICFRYLERKRCAGRAMTMLAAAHLAALENQRQSVSLLRDVVSCLGRERFVVLKGLGLGHTLYPAPHLRIVGDLDILVSSTSFPKIAASLERAGFRADMEQPIGFEIPFSRTGDGGGPEEVDVHFDSWTDRIPRAEVLAEAEEIAIDDLRVRIPSARHLPALLAAHYAHDLGDCVVWLVDYLLACRRAPDRSSLGALMRRDAARLLGLDSAETAPGASWKPLDAFWAEHAPLERSRHGEARRLKMALRIYVACLLRPSRMSATLLRAVWPPAPSSRFKDSKQWRWRRLREMLVGE